MRLENQKMKHKNTHMETSARYGPMLTDMKIAQKKTKSEKERSSYFIDDSKEQKSITEGPMVKKYYIVENKL
jgi:hypothetical protein